MRKIPQRWIYYAIGLLVIVTILIWIFTLPGLIVGGTLFGIGYYLCFGDDNLKLKNIKFHLPKDKIDTHKRNIRTGGGTYNEKIQGDCINIQGNQIYLGQDLSQFTYQIKEVLTQLQNQGFDAVSAEQGVIQDLKVEIGNNSRIKTKLIKWKKWLGVSSTYLPNDLELAERVVKFAAENSSDLEVEDKYKKLHDLLEAQKWKEADEETTQVICSLMPPSNYIYDIVAQIPPQDLRKINKLWIKFSKGRFGFSVQKDIWHEILKAYNAESNKYWVDDSVYKVFIDRVGWHRESNRIYHADLKYSQKAPRGHLPASFLLKNPCIYSSNYYELNTRIFDALMKREYYRIPFIPSWLENWLLSD